MFKFPLLQFTIKPLDKKKDVFKFYSSQLRVNKLVGSPVFMCKCSVISQTKVREMKAMPVCF